MLDTCLKFRGNDGTTLILDSQYRFHVNRDGTFYGLKGFTTAPKTQSEKLTRKALAIAFSNGKLKLSDFPKVFEVLENMPKEIPIKNARQLYVYAFVRPRRPAKPKPKPTTRFSVSLSLTQIRRGYIGILSEEHLEAYLKDAIEGWSDRLDPDHPSFHINKITIEREVAQKEDPK
jgi:hypothetical protein